MGRTNEREMREAKERNSKRFRERERERERERGADEIREIIDVLTPLIIESRAITLKQGKGIHMHDLYSLFKY